MALPMKRAFPICLTIMLAASVAASVYAQPPDAEQLALFEKKIRPVLVEHCLECHGEDEDPSGGLRLNSRAGWAVGGDSGPAITPGKPDESRLLRAIGYEDLELQMPPDGKLPDGIVEEFRLWIAGGAHDPRIDGPPVVERAAPFDLQAAREHWAYRQPRRVPAPPVSVTAWPESEIDRFILARLDQAGLQPAAEAERETLIRRLCFDLHGLPPEPEEIGRFVADDSSDAYARLVDRLLDSPRFGERWGRHWLDVVRFGESLTLRGFILPEAWRFRDYVIAAFNADRPYNQLIREHVAGDLLPADDRQQRLRQLVAATFLTLGNTNLEDQDKEQLRMDVVDEQLETIGRAFLAQTIGCARCHDHKFDPIPTRDYYSLAGILRNTKTLEHANVSKWLEMPLPLPPAEERAYEEQANALAELDGKIKQARQSLAEMEMAAPIVAADDLPGVVVDDAGAMKVGQWQTSQYTKRYVGDGYAHDQDAQKGEKTITFTPQLPAAGRYEVRLAYTAGGNRASNVPVTVFSADGEEEITVNEKQEPPIDGRWISLGSFRFENKGQHFVILSNRDTDGHVIADAVQWLTADQAAASSSSERVDNDQLRELADTVKKLTQQRKALADSRPRRPMVMTLREEEEITDCPIHVRGSVHNLSEIAPRGFLQVADYTQPVDMPADESGRRQLADWLAGAENPLTARVMANRIWHWLFGAGLVRTTDNFGATGEPPSHPELLDWLAITFVEDGWSVKSLVRRIVLSRTYRQSCSADDSVLAADPENRLWARARPDRLDAESLRDAILTVSGELDRSAAGPTIRDGVSSDYGYQHDLLRRSVYLPVLRNALPEIYEVFDFANPSVPTGRRDVSTVAPQALLLMNHPWFYGRASKAAQRLLDETPGEDDRRRVSLAFHLTLGRGPTDEELNLTIQYLDEVRQSAAETSLAEAYARLFHSLFGTLDFRYVY